MIRAKATTSKHFPAASSSVSTLFSTQNSFMQKRPIAIDSSPEPEVKKTKSSPRKTATKRKSPEDKEDERPTKRAVKEEKPSKKIVSLNLEEDANRQLLSSDEEDEKPPKPKAVPKTKTAAKSAPQKKPQIVSWIKRHDRQLTPQLLESDSEEEDEPKPKAKSKAKPASRSKSPEKKSDTKGKAKADDEDKDEKPKPKSK